MERKLIAAAVSGALALPMAAQAVEFSVSGHVNRAILSVDDGTDNDDDLKHVDSNASQSRVRFTGSEELDSGMTAGVNLEMGILTGDKDGTTTRHAALYLDTAGGKLTMGHTSAAADNMAHARLGGPSWLAGVTNWCSYHASIGASKTAVACQSNDGGRREVLRYDTPALGPATVSISAGDNDYWDARLTIAGSIGDAGYDIRIGHIGEYDKPVDPITPMPVLRGGTPATHTPEFVRFPSTRTAVSGADLYAEQFGGTAPAGTPTPEAEAAAREAYRTHRDRSGSTYQSFPTAAAARAGTSPTAVDLETGGFNGALFYNVMTPGRHDPSSVTPGTPGTIVQPDDIPQPPKKMGDITTASAAVSFGQGTSVAFAWSQDENPGSNADHEYTYVELDHSYGDGSVGVYWKQGEQGNGPGEPKTEGSLWGVGIGHNIGAGATAYAGYRVIKQDRVPDDVSVIIAGMRVTFN